MAGPPVAAPGLGSLGLADRYGPAVAEDVVDPNAETVVVEAPEIVVEAEPVPARPDLSRWWLAFGDPVLEALIERGRTDNLDVQEASPSAGGLAATTGLEAVRQRVAVAIARTYIAVRGRQAVIENIRQFLAQREAAIKLARFRAQAGLVPALDAARAIAGRDDNAARISELEAMNLRDVAQIAVLTGQAPEALGDLVSGTAQIPLGPVDVALGRPSDLLGQKADIRAAQTKLAGAGAGSEAQRTGLIGYKRAVLKALQEVEVQNAALQSAKLREIDLGRATATADAAAQLARKNYAEGLADYSTLEQVEARLLSVRNAQRQAQVERALALIGLYIALGGQAGGEKFGG
ncbi:hypothetical protein GCM10011529_06210 [Polymorphobacter glacialis]|uniref:TolC family protein n=1 Tax=Sandarakinorhabdus glacialis TaxID=1614636 RepID=A0A917E4J4_9SPHN|nr:hypothetical protein GCM10011529_06210 [Polymorphobacter glacialis]